MSKGSIITLVTLVVGLLGGMFIWKSMQRADAESTALNLPRETLRESNVYKAHTDYLEGLMRDAHGPAFATAYSSGSLFEPSEWDEQKYLELVFEYLDARARQDGRPEVADGLPAVFGKPADYREPVLGGSGEREGG